MVLPSIWMRGAYLRERGGTMAKNSASPTSRGLSPRARRNRYGVATDPAGYGPISASAEEPLTTWPQPQRSRAYLRERGGTEGDRPRRRQAQGLSPRARRNPPLKLGGGRCVGPISASAEEPSPPLSTTNVPWAYLRERGGTGTKRPVRPRIVGLSPRARRNPCDIMSQGREILLTCQRNVNQK